MPNCSSTLGCPGPCRRHVHRQVGGRIGNELFDARAAETRATQAAILRDLEAHQTANRGYIEDGVQLLKLAHGARVLFESQQPTEKRKLLNFVLSNCTWQGGELTAEYRQPFEGLEVAIAWERQRTGEGIAEAAKT
jgi:site-specific DNA recombinase